jgi:hypothetical protein
MATVLARTTPAAGHLFPIMPGLLALRARDAGVQAEALDPRIEAVREHDHDGPAGPERLRRGLAFS